MANLYTIVDAVALQGACSQGSKAHAVNETMIALESFSVKDLDSAQSFRNGASLSAHVGAMVARGLLAANGETRKTRDRASASAPRASAPIVSADALEAQALALMERCEALRSAELAQARTGADLLSALSGAA